VTWRVALCCCLLLTGLSRAQELPVEPERRVYEEVWRFFKDNFYHQPMHGTDWDALRERYQEPLQQARTQEEVHAVMSQLLGELRSSHAQMVEPYVYRNHYDAESKGRLAPRFGLKIAQLEEGFFVAEVTPGAPAAAAGVLRGDRVLTVDGVPTEEALLWPVPTDSGITSERSWYLPTLKPGDRVELELQRTPHSGSIFEVGLVSHPWNLHQACRVSRRVYERWGFKVGYIRLYHLLSPDIAGYLIEFLVEDLADADAVVVDLRGSGGLPALVDQIADIFDHNAQGGALWDKCAVALIDRHARSAKELLAWEWKRRGIGPLVGTTSAGAVLGARFEDLADGSRVLFPFMDMRSATGGVVLEGRGVRPHVEVEPVIPYVQGTDQVREKGLDVAFAELLRIQQARSKLDRWY
jgi:C-terminal processing protease CtpA/Prc